MKFHQASAITGSIVSANRRVCMIFNETDTVVSQLSKSPIIITIQQRVTGNVV